MNDRGRLRDEVATRIATFAFRRIATKRMHDRILRVFQTGDPEGRVALVPGDGWRCPFVSPSGNRCDQFCGHDGVHEALPPAETWQTP